MFFKNDFPILEFDDNKVAKLNPSALFEKKNTEKTSPVPHVFA